MKDIINNIGKAFSLKEIPGGEYASLKVNGITFDMKFYDAEGLGRVSLMKGKAMLGLMKMDTLIIDPKEVDSPLLSIENISALGNQIVICELYDTCTAPYDTAVFEEVNKTVEDIPDGKSDPHWYDDIRMKVSASKKGKKKDKVLLRQYITAYVNAFVTDACARKGLAFDIEKKQEKIDYYVGGLLKFGGPSTDVFIKGIGREKTEKLFKELLF